MRQQCQPARHLRQRLSGNFASGPVALNFLLPGGDLDGSNLVDMGDYNQLAAAWYTASPAADIDGSGLVDIFDYFLLASHWQQEGDPE